MKGRMAALDVACARVNPGLALVAAAFAMLDLALAAQRWTAVHAAVPVPARTVAAGTLAGGCAPVVALEPRDMAGRESRSVPTTNGTTARPRKRAVARAACPDAGAVPERTPRGRGAVKGKHGGPDVPRPHRLRPLMGPRSFDEAVPPISVLSNADWPLPEPAD